MKPYGAHICGASLIQMADAGQTDGGWVWKVQLIRAGRANSNPPYFLRPEVLQAAVPLFEGAPAYAHQGGQHVGDPMRRSERDKVGWYQSAAWDNAAQAIVAEFHITKNAAWLRDMIADAWSQGKRDIVEFSASFFEVGAVETLDGKKHRVPEKIVSVTSVDVVDEGATGSGLVGQMAGTHTLEEEAMREKLIALLAKYRPAMLAAIDQASITDEALMSLVEETLGAAVVQQAQQAADDGEGTGDGDGAAQYAQQAQDAATAATGTLAEMRAENARAHLRASLAESRLPEAVQNEVRAQVEAQLSANVIPKHEDIDALVTRFRAMAAALMSRAPMSLGRVSVEEGEREKWGNAMLGLLSGKREGEVAPFRSLKHAYHVMTGAGMPDAHVVLFEAGQFLPFAVAENPHLTAHYRQAQMAIKTSDLGEILGDNIHKMLIRQFSMENLNRWRSITSDITPISDFRTNHRMRFGGYGLLPAVVERGSYQPLTSPTDEEETFSIAKYGGTEALTIEAVANDDVRALRQIPQRLGRAAALTLQANVFDLFTANAVMADSVALFDAAHGNLGSSALSVTSANAVRVAMMKQSPYGVSAERLMESNEPKRLMVPADLVNTAKELRENPWTGTTDRAQNVNLGQFEIVPVSRWTDANDHVWSADPNMAPTVEVGFYQGREEPELFVQDMPQSGSMFDTDQVTWKIRHIHGVKVLEWRSFYKQVVA